MRNALIKKLVFTGLFMALTTVSTLVITFTMPVTGGYVHLGDPIVILAGILLGPVHGAIAAGLGSALADTLTPFAYYAPATLIVKALLAFLVGLAYKKMNGSERKMNIKMRTVYHAVVAYIIVVGGYFVVDFLLFYILPAKVDAETALAGAAFMLGPNSLQIIFGIIVSLVLYPLLYKPFASIYNN